MIRTFPRMRALLLMSGLVVGAEEALTLDSHGAIAEPGATVQTMMETIPNPVFGSSFRVSAACAGVTTPCSWSSSSSWSAGRIPGLSDNVVVDGNIRIDDQSAGALAVGIYPGGTLAFNHAVNTRLATGDLVVFDGGTLLIGTATQPIGSLVTAEVIIRDIPINLTSDPKQHLRAVMAVNGTVKVHGRAVTSFIRMGQEAGVGQSAIRLESSAVSVGWRAGDKIEIPNSEQCNQYDANLNRCPIDRTEERTITAISADGMTVTLSAPLTFNHPGARDIDGNLEFLPHALNMIRNVIIRSENPNGTRGHTMFHSKADVDIRYVAFLSLGRTNIQNFGPSNQKGRYPLHFHHLIGPATPQPNGRQYTAVGNVVDFGSENTTQKRKWGLTVHGSHYGLVEGNVVYRAAGAAFAAEDASETGNKWYRNFALTIVDGSGVRWEDTDPSDGSKLGRAGIGFWFNGAGYLSEYEGNVSADGYNCIYCYGFKFDNRYTGGFKVPGYQGADPNLAGQGIQTNPYAVGITHFKGNEVYASNGGYTPWWICTDFQTPIAGCSSRWEDVRMWHIYRWGIFLYETSRFTIDGLRAIGDLARRGDHTEAFATSDYMQHQLVLRNLKIHGMYRVTGGFLHLGRKVDVSTGTILVENSEFSNISYEWVTCAVGTVAPGEGANISPVNVTLRNVRFRKPAVAEAGWKSLSMASSCGASFYSYPNTPLLNTVENYNSAPGVDGPDFNVYPTFQSAPAGCNRSTAYPEVNGTACLTSVPVSSPTPDSTPPLPPANLRISGISLPEDNRLGYEPDDDIGVTGYRVSHTNNQVDTSRTVFDW